MKEILFSRINGIINCAMAKPETFKGNSYIKGVKKEIRKYNYKITLLEWMFLNIAYPPFLKVMGFCVTVYHFAKYHLGLNN